MPVDPKKEIIFTPHGVTDDEGEMLDIEFEPEWDEEKIQETP